MRADCELAPALEASDVARWHGHLDGLHGGMLYGWARDLCEPQARVAVEILFNDEAVGCVIADLARPDLGAQMAFLAGDVCHGFVADLGPCARRGHGRITARVANTAVTLGGAIDLEAPASAPMALRSQVFADGGARLCGWAAAGADGMPVTVQAWHGGRLLASAVADRRHPAVAALHDGDDGFVLELPLEIADGQPRAIEVRDAAGNSLGGSPLRVCCHAEGAAALLAQAQARPLLEDLLADYEAQLPRSLGLAHYAAWATRFEDACAPQRPHGVAGIPRRLAVLVLGEGDWQASLASLACQRQARGVAYVQAAGTRRPSLRRMLARALEEGADAVACLRAGDTLRPYGLACAAAGLGLPGAQLAYTDSEYEGQGGSLQPWFKPAWNAEYALASDCALELLLVRAGLVRELLQGGAIQDGAAFGWRALALAQRQDAAAIVHVPRVAYRFGRALSKAECKARAAAAQRALAMLETGARLLPAPAAGPVHAARRLQRQRAAAGCKISIIIPTRDRADLLARCIDSLRRHTAAERKRHQLEIIVVDNGSHEAATLAYFATLAAEGVCIVPAPGPFNYSRLNNGAVQQARGEFICLLNNDIEALHDGWLEAMLAQLLHADVGAVGAKLLWPNGMVQHGGVVLGIGGVAGHAGNLLAAQDAGDHGRNQVTQRVGAVTAACLLLRKSDYLRVGGLDESAFPVAFNDVDLCLKLQRLGKAILWTPDACLLHAESASRGAEDSAQKQARAARETQLLRARWQSALLGDPFYHPSLNLDARAQAYSGLALPPRPRPPRRAQDPQGEPAWP